MSDEHPETDPAFDDEPPPLGSWPRMYAVVLGNLVLCIVLFYLFMRFFS